MTNEEWEEAERIYERQTMQDAAGAALFDELAVAQMYREIDEANMKPFTSKQSRNPTL